MAGFTYMPRSPSTTDFVSFDSTSIDPDGDIINWTWDLDDGSYGFGEFFKHRYAENGIYSVNLTVKDNDGATDYFTQTVFVGNKPPVAIGNTATVNEDTIDNLIDVLFDDYDVNGDNITIFSVSSPFNGSVTTDGNFLYYTPNQDHYGSDQFNYTVFDGKSETDTAIVTINIINVNDTPVARFAYEPSNPSTTDLVSFYNTSIDHDGDIVNWTWDLDDGNSSYGEFFKHRYAENGSYSVNLTVKDSNGTTNSINQIVYVGNQLPTAGFTYMPRSPSTTDFVSFDSTSIDPDASIVNETILIRNMWFLDRITTTLEHIDIDIEKTIIHQWTYNFSFIINRSGTFKLAFLLFKTPMENYTIGNDYEDQAKYILENVYRELHFWVDVFYQIPPVANFTISSGKPTIEDTILFISNSTSINSSISSWKWDFGDGNTSFGEIIGLKFDGIDDFIDCGTNESLQPINGTFEAWIYSKDYTGWRKIFAGSYIVSYRRHGSFSINNNLLVLTLTNTDKREWEGHTYYAGFKTNVWYYVAATWDGSHVSFYINGSQKQRDNQRLVPVGNTDPKRIGALDPPWNPQVFNGIIKDIRIYNRSLNNTEIQNNYNGNITTTNLVSWWMMNDGGDIANDAMGRYNGTIHGANWINQASHKYSHPGTYNVTLTISNEFRQIHSISKIITVK